MAKSQSDRGAVFLETVLSLVIFMTTIQLGADLARLSYTAVALNSAVARSGRWAELGLAHSNDMVLNDPGRGVDSVRRKIEEMSKLQIDASQFSICPAGNPEAGCTQNSRGAAMNWMYIKAAVPVSMLFGLGTINISGSAVVQNEPGFRLRAVEDIETSRVSVEFGEQSLSVF